MISFPIISIILLIPIFSALFIAFFVKSNNSESRILYIKYLFILSTFLTFISSLFLIGYFQKASGGYQFVENIPIIKYLNFNYHVGVDGISILFVILTTLLSFLISFSSYEHAHNRIKEYVICFLILEAASVGSFVAIDSLLFYFFFEIILIPMFFIIGIWGGENKIYAAFKFFLYTLIGSLCFLTAIIYLNITFDTFDMNVIQEKAKTLTLDKQKFLWILMFFGFAIKVPMVPFHTWLPDAHVEAPTAGSVILAGILLKLGGYGFIRFSITMLPDASIYFANFVVLISVSAILYASFVAYAQTNIKKMIAYSSVAHMGYVTAGIFSLNIEGLTGAIFQMISHGVISAGLFLIVGSLYERFHTKEINDFGGLAFRMPFLATFMMILTLGSVGLPGTSGFVGEFLSMIGIFKFNKLFGTLSAFGVIFGAIYMLFLYRKVMLGSHKSNHELGTLDASFIEKFYYTVLCSLVIYMGIFAHHINSFYLSDLLNILK
jgi:NADH-quinone oxidoreductase subunit M